MCVVYGWNNQDPSVMREDPADPHVLHWESGIMQINVCPDKNRSGTRVVEAVDRGCMLASPNHHSMCEE